MTLRLCTALAASLLLAGGALADVRSDAILAKAKKLALAARSLEASVSMKTSGSGMPGSELTGKVSLLRPNFGELILKTPGGSQEIRSDGKTLFIVLPEQKQLMKRNSDPKGSFFAGIKGSPLGFFLDPTTVAGKSKYGGVRKIGAKTYQIVEMASTQPPGTRRLLFDPSGRYEGLELEINAAPGTKLKTEFWLKDLKLNVPAKPERFAYTPPADFSEPKEPDDSLLAVGAAAPDFLLPVAGGSPVSLEGLRKDKKAVLVNFWFYG